MAKASIALSELVEKGAKDDIVRELLGHVAERLMEFEIEQRCGAEYASAAPIAATAATAIATVYGKRAPVRSTFAFRSCAKAAIFQPCSSLGERPRRRWSPSCKKRPSKASRRAPSTRSFKRWA